MNVMKKRNNHVETQKLNSMKTKKNESATNVAMIRVMDKG